MKALYPVALRALTVHYTTMLRKPPQEAATLAKLSLDRTVASHFVFAKGE